MELHRTGWLDHARQDVHFGLRTMWRSPGFTAAVTVTLAVGVAAVVTLFAVLDAVILRPLPYPRADQLVLAWTVDTKSTAAVADTPVSLPDLQDWQTLGTFEAVAGFRSTNTFLKAASDDVPVDLVESTPGFLALLGVQPVTGRIWTADEGLSRTLRPVLVSHALWQDVLGSSSAVVGRVVTIAQSRYEVIGVMPRGFRTPALAASPGIALTQPYAAWSPFVPRPVHQLRGNRGLRVLARVRSGRTLRDGQTALAALADRLAAAYPETNGGKTARLTPLDEGIAGRNRRALEGIAAAGGLLLLIACTNAAGLVLVRTNARHREWRARASLGATRNRLVGQVLVETGLLSLIGSALGIGLAALLIRSGALVFADTDLPRLADAALNGRAVAVGLLLGVLAACLVGLAPAGALAVLAARVEPPGTHGRSDPRSGRVRHVLVATQVALALTLAVSAALLLSSVSRLVGSPGFDHPGRMLLFQSTVIGTRWTGDEATRQLYATLRERLGALPGVEDVAFTTHILNLGDASTSDVVVHGAPPRPADERPMAAYTLADDTFLKMSGSRLLEGRMFTLDDRAAGPRVAIVNRAFVTAAGLDGGGVGRLVSLSGLGAEPFQVVGVVTDSHAGELGGTDGPRLYYSPVQLPSTRFVVLVKWSADMPDAAASVRRAVRETDPQLPVLDVQTLAQAVAKSAARPRRSSAVVGSFTIVALFLASVGVYGLVSYIVSGRTKECGIRLALGATRAHVCRVMAMQGIAPVATGLVAGAFGGLAADALLAHFGFLYPIHDDRSAVVGGAILLVAVATVAASLWPAARASRVEPLPLLRQD